MFKYYRISSSTSLKYGATLRVMVLLVVVLKTEDCLEIIPLKQGSKHVDRLFERQICSSQIELPVLVAIVTHVLKMNSLKL